MWCVNLTAIWRFLLCVNGMIHISMCRKKYSRFRDATGQNLVSGRSGHVRPCAMGLFYFRHGRWEYVCGGGHVDFVNMLIIL